MFIFILFYYFSSSSEGSTDNSIIPVITLSVEALHLSLFPLHPRFPPQYKLGVHGEHCGNHTGEWDKGIIPLAEIVRKQTAFLPTAGAEKAGNKPVIQLRALYR